MSSDFYFYQWGRVLEQLEAIVEVDEEYQNSKQKDKTICNAALRQSSLLTQYTAAYNTIHECKLHNYQLQKTSYIDNILQAVVARILEIRTHLRKLEGNEYQFLSQGLAFSKLTPNDVELQAVPEVQRRAEFLDDIVREAFEADRERRRLEELKLLQPDEEDVEDKWWEMEDAEENADGVMVFEEQAPKLTQEQIDTKRYAEIIQAQERSRQVIFELTQSKHKRAKWENELRGLANPPASLETRHRAARLIQMVCRKYFEIKRQKILDCKVDEMIGVRSCLKSTSHQKEMWEQKAETRVKFKQKHEDIRPAQYQEIKDRLYKQLNENIKEDYRDFVMEWFQFWYDEIHYFHDLPDPSQGGIAMLLTDQMPAPLEWMEKYKQYLADKKANKNKSAMQLKYEKQEAKRELALQKKEEQKKKKHEEQLKRKMMKNPGLHPGYEYPKSKKMAQLKEAISSYKEIWTELDKTEERHVKEKVVKQMDTENICKEIKEEIAANVGEDMKDILKTLRKALKIDYENSEEPMLEPMKEKKKPKKKAKVKKTPSENIKEKIQALIFQGFMKEYPKTKLEHFKGDINFAGDQFRCDYKKSPHSNGEIRSLWWERCRSLTRGFQKLLVVGPKGSGKTTLVHVMATVNDAVLFELDPRNVRPELQSDVSLEQAINSLTTCARALQPTVIHIKHVQRLFYRKVPPEESEINYNLMKRYFIKKLFKKINKQDNVSIVATCLDPWLTRSAQMLKSFPDVIMMPNTSYSTVVQLLKEWMHSNHVIPPDLDVGSLAQVLQGYSYGSLLKLLDDFLTPDRLVRIKMLGLSPIEIYNFIIDQDSEETVEYEKYEKWYTERTEIGQRELKHTREQMEFREAVEKFELSKMKKEKSSHSMATSSTGA